MTCRDMVIEMCGSFVSCPVLGGISPLVLLSFMQYNIV